jgi:hypothetical protein
VTVYATKEATDYHKAFARWIVQEVGYNPKTATSASAAFLAGVSIATAARPAFMDSEFLEEWRAKTGVNKRGPKGTQGEEAEEVTPARRTKRAPAPVEEDEFDDAEADDEDEDDYEDADEDESDEDYEDDDDSDEDDEEDDDDFEDEEEDEVEETPAPRRRGRPAAKAAPAKAAPAKRAPAKAAAKAAPARGRRAAAPVADDDEFLF